MTMVKTIFSRSVFGIVVKLLIIPIIIGRCELSPHNKRPRENFRLAGPCCDYHSLALILAQMDRPHNTPPTLSPVLCKILHKRPESSGQLLCASSRRNAARKMPRAIGPASSSCNGSVLFPARVKHFSGPPGKVWQIWRRGFPQGACKVGQPAQNAFGGGFSVSFSQFFSRIA